MDTRTWAYRMGDDGLESKIFPSPEEVPEGWADTPANLEAKAPEKGDPNEMPNLDGLEEKEAKRALDEWAATIGVKLDRRKSLDKMLAQLESELGNAD